MQEDICCKNMGDFIIELNSNLQILVIFHTQFLQHMHLCVSFNSSEQNPTYNIIYILFIMSVMIKLEVLEYSKPEGKMLKDYAEQNKAILVHSYL